MSDQSQQVFDAALGLPEAERALLAERLLESLEEHAKWSFAKIHSQARAWEQGKLLVARVGLARVSAPEIHSFVGDR